jgi:Icc-related predicted phosphoesterase
VVLSGDALSIAAHVPVEAQIVAVRTTLAELARRTRLVLCSGNHDLDGLNGAGEKMARWVAELDLDGVIVDGRTVTVEGWLLTVLPWWDGPAARAEVDALLEETAHRRDEHPWIWVYHSPPECRLSWTGSRHYGDEAARTWIDRHEPDVVLCGHIHQAPFTPEGSWIDRIGATWLFNPGRQMGNVPCCVDLDLGAGRAAWMSATGLEERSLDVTSSASGQ